MTSFYLTTAAALSATAWTARAVKPRLHLAVAVVGCSAVIAAAILLTQHG